MSVQSFKEAKNHVGHHIVCVIYANQNISFECEQCNEIIIDFEKVE